MMTKDFKDLLRAFNANAVKYLIVGGHALGVHLVPRMTKDLDLFIRSDPENAAAAFRALAQFGAPLEGMSPTDFADGTTFQIGQEPDRIDILQLHTWTRAWNRNPAPFEVLRALKKEGKVRLVGVSTPEHDQNSVIDLMRGGWVDVVQVIYNIFEQEPAAELLPAAAEAGVGGIVRVVFDEGSLTGKWTRDTVFPEGDFRRAYFEGDRLGRSVARAARVAEAIKGSGFTLAQAAIKFALAHDAVGTVIPGMRNPRQAEENCRVSDLPAMTPGLQQSLRGHNWRRGFWYAGK